MKAGTARRFRAGLGASVLAGILAGCGGGAAPATPSAGPSAPAPTAAGPTAGAPTAAAPRTTVVAVCSEHAKSAAAIRFYAEVMRKGPIPPVGIALFLLSAREQASVAGIADPALAAAEVEVVAAIDDLDAQGRAGLPPGGNAAENVVQIDPTRVLAAVDAVDRVCAAPR